MDYEFPVWERISNGEYKGEFYGETVTANFEPYEDEEEPGSGYWFIETECRSRTDDSRNDLCRSWQCTAEKRDSAGTIFTITQDTDTLDDLAPQFNDALEQLLEIHPLIIENHRWEISYCDYTPENIQEDFIDENAESVDEYEIVGIVLKQLRSLQINLGPHWKFASVSFITSWDYIGGNHDMDFYEHCTYWIEDGNPPSRTDLNSQRVTYFTDDEDFVPADEIVPRHGHMYRSYDVESPERIGL